VDGLSTPASTCKAAPPSPPPAPNWRRWGKKVRQDPESAELHYQDETHLETNPYLCRVWHRKGRQATRPAAGTNRRVTVYGSVEALACGRVEGVRAEANSAGFVRYLELLEARHQAVGREIYLVLDNSSVHTSKTSQQALAQRKDWLHVIWLAKYAPQLNPKEREWRWLKRDARHYLAPTLRAFVDGIVQGLAQLGGSRQEIVDEVPDWFLDGHRKPPTGRRPGRPKGAKDSYKRAPYRRNNLLTDT
jgi:transposase